jgi:F-type H+-transporting ATPase subunit delta
MARSPAARRYARALFELAQEQGRLDVVQADLKELARLGEKKADYSALLDRFEWSATDRKKVWSTLIEGRADPLTLRFVHFLVDKQRGTILGDIIRAFEVLYNEVKGIATLEVLAARPLAESQMRALSDRFAAKLGRTIKATQSTDSSLLGGFQVRAGDVVYDYSVSHQLEQLHRKMITA